MRFLCRIGIHKWGKWSDEWYKVQYITGYDYHVRKTYRIYRSLKCECCAALKHKKTETVTGLGPITDTQPFWD